MGNQICHYKEMTASQLAALDRSKTLALMALSPLEVHGPHLPVGTDVYVAQEVARRVVDRVGEVWPDTTFLLLPPMFAGADALPLPGSVPVDSRTLYGLLRAIGGALADQGFRWLVLCDNHGGPRHQLAIARAVRDLYRKRGFALLVPFLRLYRRMIECEPRLLVETGTGPGACGDDPDAHAGTNETSLMLVTAPERIVGDWQRVDRAVVAGDAPVARLLHGAARAAARLGRTEMARDLDHLGATLAWVGMEDMPNYMGAPARARSEAGEAMLEAHVAEAVDMLREVREGAAPFHKPVLWSLRLLERVA